MKPLSYASLRSGMDRRVGNFVYTLSAMQNSMSLSLCRGRPKHCAGSITPWHNSWSNLRNLNFSLVCAALYSRHFWAYVFFAFLAAIAYLLLLPSDGLTMRIVLGSARESIAFVVEQASRLFAQPRRPLFCSKGTSPCLSAYFGTATFD